MIKKDLLEKIKNAKDDEDINSLLGGTDIEEQFKASGLTLEAFKAKFKEKEFKSFLESENDKHFNKALATWKENNLEKELEPFISAKYPDLATDPKDKAMAEMKKKLEQMEKEAARKDLLAEAIKYANEKKLPISFVEKLLGEDLEKTKSNLDGFAEDWSKGIESVVTERMKDASYIPQIGGDPKKSIGEMIAEQNNITNSASNPWA